MLEIKVSAKVVFPEKVVVKYILKELTILDRLLYLYL